MKKLEKNIKPAAQDDAPKMSDMDMPAEAKGMLEGETGPDDVKENTLQAESSAKMGLKASAGAPKIGKKITPASTELGSLSSGMADKPISLDVNPAPAQPAGDVPLLLPKNALVIMRSSGGLKFTSKEATVFEDGSVTVRDATQDTAKPSAGAKLSNADFNKIKDLLKPDTFKNAPTTSTPKPDRYAHELAARIGRSTKRAEVADGAIPAQIQPLVDALKKLLPK